jgi:hypothetical protein
MESSKGFETASNENLFYSTLVWAQSCRVVNELFTSHLKNASNAQLRCCEPLQNAHILPRMLCFFIGSRLVLERDLNF